jgi:hypothetical protein
MRMTAEFAAVSALCLSALVQPPAARAEEPRHQDLFGLGLNFREICDLTPGAPVSDRCYGFMGAVIEMALSSQGLREQGFDETSFLFVRTCVPPGVMLEEIIEVIRVQIDTHPMLSQCTALCSETGYVLSALESAYPCPEEE